MKTTTQAPRRSVSVKVDVDVADTIDRWRLDDRNPSSFLRRIIERAVRRQDKKYRIAEEAR